MATERRQGERLGRPALTPADAAQRIYGTVRDITLDEITIDSSIQVRVDGLDEARVEQYVEFLLEGGSFKDPIIVFQDGEELVLSAGFHRCEAYRRASQRFSSSVLAPALAPLRAEVRQGGRSAAIEFAEEDNLTHGLELRLKDKRHLLERRWKRGHAWQHLSNRAIAAKLGVTRETVAAWRSELEQLAGIRPVARVGADGKVRDVSNIEAANQLRAAREAFHGLHLPMPEVGTPDFKQINALRSELFASVDYLKTLFESGARLRPWLPWALSIELDADEPRLTLINWLRGELPKWKEEQGQGGEREKGKTEQANDRVAVKFTELQSAVLAVVAGQPPMSYREIEFAVNAHLGRIANPGLLSGAITQLTRDGRLRNVGGGRYALAEPSDNRYQSEYELSGNSLQIDTGEQADDWLERSARKAPSMATAANGAPAHADDHDPDLDAAYRASAELSRGVIGLLQTGDALMQLRGIRALHALPKDKLQRHINELDELRMQTRNIVAYCDMQIARLQEMQRTGQPYNEEKA